MKATDRTETEYLPKTAEWFSKHELLPHIGDTIIPLETETAKKPFYIGKEYLVKSSHFGKLLIADDNGFSDYFHPNGLRKEIRAIPGKLRVIHKKIIPDKVFI